MLDHAHRASRYLEDRLKSSTFVQAIQINHPPSQTEILITGLINLWQLATMHKEGVWGKRSAHQIGNIGRIPPNHPMRHIQHHTYSAKSVLQEEYPEEFFGENA
jgi:hypothetical protein